MDGFTWQHIQFANGSNPYICKTEEEFKRINRKYKLTEIKSGFWIAEEKNHTPVIDLFDFMNGGFDYEIE